MRRGTRSLVALLGVLAVVAGCSTAPTPHPTPHPTPSSSTVRVRPRGDLTPGEVDPRVTQVTIHSTICVPGWTKTVRPPESYTAALKRLQIDQYGYADKNPAHYEEDHLIPLELGGAPSDPRNLWPEPGASPNPKDHEENDLHTRVCSGTLTLDEARAQIMRDWGPVG